MSPAEKSNPRHPSNKLKSSFVCIANSTCLPSPFFIITNICTDDIYMHIKHTFDKTSSWWRGAFAALQPLPPESATLTLMHFYCYVIRARLTNRTLYLHVCMLHSFTVVAFTGATTMHVAVHMHMSVQPWQLWRFHNALDRAQIYCTEPCAPRWTFTVHTHTVKERARRPDLVWLSSSNVLRLDGCPARITLSNDTKMEK